MTNTVCDKMRDDLTLPCNQHYLSDCQQLHQRASSWRGRAWVVIGLISISTLALAQSNSQDEIFYASASASSSANNENAIAESSQAQIGYAAVTDFADANRAVLAEATQKLKTTVNARVAEIGIAVADAEEPLDQSVSINDTLPQADDEFAGCSEQFLQGVAPQYLNTTLRREAVPLCFDGFAVMYSGVSLTPLWSAEHLTRDRLVQADRLPREDNFHPERRLPQRLRAEIRDYADSGYDRGHLAPNADMASTSQQYDSFSLANIAPQAAGLNRYGWRDVESVTRYLTKQYGETYVLTGVVFSGARIELIGDRVMVPTHFYKVVYVPALQRAGVYYAPNDASGRMEVISLDELALRSGVDAMPMLTADVQAVAQPWAVRVSDITRDEASASGEELTFWLSMVNRLMNWIVERFTA